MKIKLHYLPLIIFVLFIIIFIAYSIYTNNLVSNAHKEGFITKFYRPYYRTIKQQVNKYYNYFMKY